MFANQQVLTALQRHDQSTSASLQRLGENDVALGKKIDALGVNIDALAAIISKLAAGSIPASEAAALTADLKASSDKLKTAVDAAPHPS